MRAAELIEPGRFRLTESPIAEPGPGEVQVQVAAVGICGSDLHSFTEGAVGDMPSRFPMVLGHEPAGIVLKTGPGVTGWAPGDRAALEPSIYCYHCEFCRAGHHNVCANLRFLSQPGDPGFFRDRVNLPAANLLPLPPALGLREATLFEPLAVVLHSLNLAKVQQGETAVVLGAGPIGLLTVACLKLFGAARVWSVEPVPHRRQMALAAGADAVLDASEEAVRDILAATAQRGVDVAFDCATMGNSIDSCLRLACNAGRAVITRIPSGVRVPIEFHVARRKELAILNVRRSNHESEQALELLREHPGRFAPIITHSRPIEEIEAAFRTAAGCEDGVGKHIIELRP